ncbi:MAG: hypothetical protein H0V12_06990 [Chloroflexi bacterium]|nr:hypothetical protein [Chloroflexota bacterium]
MTEQTATPAQASSAPTAMSHRSTRRHRGPGRRFLATLLAPALLLGAAAAPVQAYTITSRTSVPTLPTIYQVQGAHYDAGSAVTGPMWKPWLYQSGPVVKRVSGSGSQSVQVTYKFDRWNGSSWVNQGTRTGSVTIAASATSAKAPNLSVTPSAGSGYYRVRLGLTWTSQIGAVLGSMSVSMNQSGDYVCSTTRTCSTGPGWVYIGN